MEIHNRGKFHSYSICGCQVMNFQLFSQDQKRGFQAAFRWFFGYNSPKCSRILLKFGPVTHCIEIYYTCYIFDKILKIPRNYAKTRIFWLLFRGFLRPVDHAPIFFQMKVLMVIHNPGKFHHDSICGSKVINFQMFLW